MGFGPEPISLPSEAIGERVLSRLCRRIEEGEGFSDETEIVPHELVVRQSVAPPRK